MNSNKYFVENLNIPRAEMEYMQRSPSDIAARHFFYVEEIGRFNIKKIKRTLMHHSIYTLLFFEGSNITVKHLSKNIKLHSEVFVVLKPKVTYQITVNGDNCRIWWFTFTGKYLKNLCEHYLQGKNNFYRSYDAFGIKLIWDDLFNLSKHDSDLNDLKMNEVILKLFRLLYEQDVGKSIVARAEKRYIAFEVREYIDTHYFEKVNLDKISMEINVSKYYMSRKFKKAYGMSVIQYLTHVRMAKAKELLQIGGYSYNEIAEKIGVDNENYFLRIFKKEENMTPREYVNKMKL